MKLLVFLLSLFLFIKIVVAFNDQSLTCGINKLKKEKPSTHFFENSKIDKRYSNFGGDKRKQDSQYDTKGQLKKNNSEDAIPHEFPWIASFGKTVQEGSKSIYISYCGGSIIHPQFILTAAHCEEIFDNENVSAVVVGVHNISLEAPEPNRVSLPIAQFIKHPEFVDDGMYESSFRFDVALVKLASPLDIAGNADLGTVCVPPQNATYNPYVGELLTEVGWNLTKCNETSQVLRKGTLPIEDMDLCRGNFILDYWNTMICSLPNKDDVFRAYSGGPLMKKMDDGRWTVVGIFSWGEGCDDEYPITVRRVYAHVSLFSDWIWETVKANGG